MVEILALVLHHDEQAVLTAVELALEAGAPSKQHVLNVLGRLIGETPPAPVDRAAGAGAGASSREANVSRYDALREGTSCSMTRGGHCSEVAASSIGMARPGR